MGSDDRVFPEEMIEPVIMPLDDAVERMIAVDIATVRKVLASQGMHVVTEKEAAFWRTVEGLTGNGFGLRSNGGCPRCECGDVYLSRPGARPGLQCLNCSWVMTV